MNGTDAWLEDTGLPLTLTVTGGVTVENNEVRLVRPAPDSGVDITVRSNRGRFVRPAPNPVHMPPGSTTGAFIVFTTPVGGRLDALITASDGVVTREILELTLLPEEGDV
jgi:hypothetical protein